MNLKKYFLISALLVVLLVSINAINATSDDSLVNSTFSIDDGNLILQNATQDNLESNVDSSSSLEQSNKNSNTVNTAAKTTSSKSNLKINTPSNFVKKGSKYYFYLVDSKGNPVTNKKLSLNFNGKIYEKSTDKNGRIALKVGLSKSSSSIKVTFKGDKKYKAFSKKLSFYIEESVPFKIGNSKLLTNGYLRIYLNGPKKSISHKTVKIIIGKKVFTKNTSSEGFVVIKPQVAPKRYTVMVKYNKYRYSKKINCINGNVSDPLKVSIPTKKGVPDIDLMPGNYVMGDNNGRYTLKKSQYLEVIKRDSYSLYLYGKLSKYTFFKVKSSPNTYHVMKREKWNVIERTINTIVVKKNKYNYWPSSVTVSLKGKSYTYSEVRDIQNTIYSCGHASASVCSQALRNYHSEKFFEKNMVGKKGVNIPEVKKGLEKYNFKTYYFNKKTLNNALKELKNGVALIAYLPRHYVSIIDVSPDGKKILISNSYGDYNVGGLSRVPTNWVSLKYFKTKFANTGLVVKLDYKLSKNTENQIKNFYSSMGPNWQRQNTKERIPNIGL